MNSVVDIMSPVAVAMAFMLLNTELVLGDPGYVYTGFTRKGTKILDTHGANFIIRGVNYLHAWFPQDVDKGIPAVANQTGANTIRIVLSNGQHPDYTKTEASAVRHVLDLCKEHKMVAMLEVHDATGKNEKGPLEEAVKYWISLGDVLRGRERHVMINIANEWMGDTSESACSNWVKAYKAVIPMLRRANLQHLLVIDAPGYGQNGDFCVGKKGRDIAYVDPNIIFAVHMYGVAGKDSATITRHIDDILALNVPVIIGEFSDRQREGLVDYKSILSICQEKGVGYLPWAWHGVAKPDDNMNMAVGPEGPLTNLGEELVSGPNGIKQTSQKPDIW